MLLWCIQCSVSAVLLVPGVASSVCTARLCWKLVWSIHSVEFSFVIRMFTIRAVAVLATWFALFCPGRPCLQWVSGFRIIGNRSLRSHRSVTDMTKARPNLLNLIEKVNTKSDKQDAFAPLWEAMRFEAAAMCQEDLRATSLMTNAILSQPSFESALIDFVSNQLETPLFQATQIRNIFAEACSLNSSIPTAWAMDLLASAVRDKSQPNTVSVLLFNKGFHALATHRVAHTLWYTGRDGLASYFQSLASRIFASDIHPACNIGPGCYISTGSGVVIGETASVGRECCIKHGVTLGGTGKESGDRHPKLGNGVFVAAGASILGNIYIGDNSVVNAGSVVTKAVAPNTRVGGVPARFISNLTTTETTALAEKTTTQESLASKLGLKVDLDGVNRQEELSETMYHSMYQYSDGI
jgi:serine O-acetyltransferase